MNLIDDSWLPFRKRDGSIEYFPVVAVVEPDVVDVALPRGDFQGAGYQFLIGLLQTTFAPEDKQQWAERYEQPPSSLELSEVLREARGAFDLDVAAPAFMQDLEALEGEKQSSVAGLLIDAPGASTIKNNTDHFVKAGRTKEICPDCAAMALFTLQINAPGGGKGHRTGLRGGGPLATLVMPDDAKASLWQKLWLNVMDRETWGYESPDYGDRDVFPWLGQTRISDKGQMVTPDDVHPLHAYWAMPRRIRLEIEEAACRCDLCGRHSARRVRHIRARNYGYNYEGPWTHPLTPYRFDPQKPEQLPYSRKAQKDGLGYRHWESLVLADKQEAGNLPAPVVLDYAEKYRAARDYDLALPRTARIWVFGYDMDKMKARGWYGAHMPLVALPRDRQAVLQAWLRQVVDLTRSAASLLQTHIKEAWFSKPKDVKGDTSFLTASLWEATEQDFYRLLAALGELLAEDERGGDLRHFPEALAAQWYRDITGRACQLFDDYALSGPAEQLDMKRIIAARNAFSKKLFGGKEAKAFRKMGGLEGNDAEKAA